MKNAETCMIFDHITPENLKEMMHCFRAVQKHFSSGERILRYTDHSESIGVMLSGDAHLVKYDDDGYKNIIEHLKENSVFGSLLIRPFAEEAFEVVAISNCMVLFFDYAHLIKRCEKACPHHSILTNNMLQILSCQSQYLHMRIDVLSQRTTRGKLLSYFHILSRQQQASRITLPFPLYSLADYLFVDRSAMFRELKKLKEEGMIASKGKIITLMKFNWCSDNRKN